MSSTRQFSWVTWVPSLVIILVFVGYLLDFWSIQITWSPVGNQKYKLRPKALHPTQGHSIFEHTESVRKTTSTKRQNMTYLRLPLVRVTAVNCKRIFESDTKEIYKAKQYHNLHTKVKVTSMEMMKRTSNCTDFRTSRGYISSAVTMEEKKFPIAFSLLVFKDIEPVERLLRAMYRPQNIYCIHVDAKSDIYFYKAVRKLASCFKNVFLLQKRVDVEWGWFSVLKPEILCMKELHRRSKKWKYFINLTGQEWPLKTNAQLVKILKAYKGAADMEGTVQRRDPTRTLFVHDGIMMREPMIKKPPFPYDVTITKGSVHIVVPRAFVKFVLHNNVSNAFLDWIQDTGVPDETFFSSLRHSPQLGVPGAYKGIPETTKVGDKGRQNPFLARFKNWGTWPFDFDCDGMRVRMVCVFDVGDLRRLASGPELFANKFYYDKFFLAYDCMEELHWNRTREDYEGKSKFDTKYYEELDFVKNHVSATT